MAQYQKIDPYREKTGNLYEPVKQEPLNNMVQNPVTIDNADSSDSPDLAAIANPKPKKKKKAQRTKSAKTTKQSKIIEEKDGIHNRSEQEKEENVPGKETGDGDTKDSGSKNNPFGELTD